MDGSGECEEKLNGHGERDEQADDESDQSSGLSQWDLVGQRVTQTRDEEETEVPESQVR